MCQRNPDQNAVLSLVSKENFSRNSIVRKLNDEKSKEDVAVIISHDGEILSVDQVKWWVDNFKASLKKQKGEEPEPNDQESDSMRI